MLSVKAKAATETIYLELEGHTGHPVGLTSKKLSHALKKEEEMTFPLSCRDKARPKARRLTDWQLGFDFIVTTEEDDIHLVPVLSKTGGERPPTSCQRRGTQLRMQQQAIWASFLCLKTQSLTKPSCTCLKSPPDSSSSSSVAIHFFLFLLVIIFSEKLLPLLRREPSTLWVTASLQSPKRPS